MADVEQVRVEQVLAVFSKHQAIVDASGTIAWRHLRRVLQSIDPSTFSDEALQSLCKEAAPGGREAEPTTRIPLEAFLGYVFGAGDAAGKVLAAALGVAAVMGAAEDEPEALRVRKAAGDVVLALTAKELSGLQVGGLKERVCVATGRLQCEVQLIAKGQPLQDGDSLEELLQGQEVLEILLLAKELPKFDPDVPALEQLPALKKLIFSEDKESQLIGCTHIRKVLSIERDPPIEQIIKAGLVPRLVHLASAPDAYHVQFEAMWALTNVASGTTEHTRAVVDNGAVPIFVQSLGSPSTDVREQAVWALGNIAGDSTDFRNMVLDAGAVPPLLAVLDGATKVSLLRNATWTLSNLARGKPPPAFELLAPALPLLATLLQSVDDEVLADACWAISYLSDGANDRIQCVVEAGVCGALVRLLSHGNCAVQTPALRAVGNIVTGDEGQTEAILSIAALPSFHALLRHTKKSIRKEACWALSNILAGSRGQIQQVINEVLLPPLIALLTVRDADVQKEAVWAISNLTDGGSPEQVECAVHCGCINPLLEVMSDGPERVTRCVLSAIANILEVGQKKQESQGLVQNPFAELVKRSPSCERISAVAHMEEGAAQRILSILALADGREEEERESAKEGEADEEHIPEEDTPKTAGAADEYTIALQSDSGKAMGLTVSSDRLAVRCSEGTLLAEWNAAHPGAEVAEADVLVAVNGLRGDAELRHALAHGGPALELTFRRAHASYL